MEFRTHPVLSDLKCNEDGTIIKYQDTKLITKTYPTKTGRILRKVNFRHTTHSVAKIVCECFNGMRDRTDMIVIRKDQDFDNDHYTNLEWGFRGGWDNASKRKLNTNQENEIIELLSQGIVRQFVAEKFGVSLSVIDRIKRKYK